MATGWQEAGPKACAWQEAGRTAVATNELSSWPHVKDVVFWFGEVELLSAARPFLRQQTAPGAA